MKRALKLKSTLGRWDGRVRVCVCLCVCVCVGGPSVWSASLGNLRKKKRGKKRLTHF